MEKYYLDKIEKFPKLRCADAYKYMLEANFEGDEKEHNEILNGTSKYGNDSSPFQGREKCGPTASILSSTKWSHKVYRRLQRLFRPFKQGNAGGSNYGNRTRNISSLV